MPQSFSWTPEWCERLTELWAQGLSCAQIGRQLGCSRNSVIGKARRMGFEPRDAKACQWGRHKRLPPKPKPRPAPLPVETAAAVSGITIETIHDGMCRYPMRGTGIDMEFCAAPTRGLYCAAHHAIAYTPAKPRAASVRLRADGRPWD